MALSNLYLKHYKKLMILPLSVLVFFSSVILITKLTTGSFFYKDISLSGGTSLTVYTSDDHDLSELQSWAKQALSTDSSVIKLTNPLTGRLSGYEFRTSLVLDKEEADLLLGDYFGFALTSDNFSMGVQSADIASSFFNESLIVILVSFLLMSFVAFYYFRSIIPSASIIFSTIADVIVVIGVHDLLRIPLSISSIGALLMLIAYSTDSDIVLATNVIKRKEGKLIDRMRNAWRTELTMSLAALVTFTVMLLMTNIDIIRSISLILLIGTLSDLLNTWLLSAGLQRTYLERKGR